MRWFQPRDRGGPRLDDATVDLLFSGAVSPFDVAPELAGAVAVLTALRAQPDPVELGDGPNVVAAMQRELAAPGVATPQPRRQSHLARQRVAVKAAVMTAGVLFTASAAAAATGNLPDSAQQTASDMLSRLGISVPGSNSHAGTHGNSSGHQPGSGPNSNGSKGPSANADFGLCTAENASDGHPNSSVFPSPTVCSTVTHPGQPQGTGKPPTAPTGGTPNHGAASGNPAAGGPNVTNGGGSTGGSRNLIHPSHP